MSNKPPKLHYYHFANVFAIIGAFMTFVILNYAALTSDNYKFGISAIVGGFIFIILNIIKYKAPSNQEITPIVTQVNLETKPKTVFEASSLAINMKLATALFLIGFSGFLIIGVIKILLSQSEELRIPTNDSDLITLITFIIVGAGILALVYLGVKRLSVFIKEQKAGLETRCLVFSESGIKVGTMLMEGKVKRELTRKNIFSIYLDWSELKKILIWRLRDGTSGKAYYELKIKDGLFLANLGKSTQSDEISIDRVNFYDCDNDIVNAFKKYARCPIEIEDNMI